MPGSTSKVVLVLVLLFPLFLAGSQAPSQAYAQTGVERWAVIVGVSDYLYLDDDLEYCDEDARDLAAQLEPIFGEEHIRVLVDSSATKQNVRSAINDWLDPREDADDVVMFFFSGHGSSGYLFPHDSLLTSYGNDITPAELDNWLDALESGKMTVILDSCESGDYIDGLTQNGRVLISCGGPGESCWADNWLEHSYLSHYLIEAFDHPETVDANGDHGISAEEVFEYTKPKVVSYAASEDESQIPGIVDNYSGYLTLYTIATVTFNSSPRISAITIDGTRYSAYRLPVSFTWPVGSRHTVRTTATAVSSGEEYMFSSWSDGESSISRDLTVTDSATYTALYAKHQYPLTVISEFGDVNGAGLYDDNSLASFSVPAVVDHHDGTRHVFAGWSGDATVTSPEASVRMNSAKTVRAEWQLQYRLTVDSEYGQPRYDQWHDAGSPAVFSISAIEDHGDGSRHKFTGWGLPAGPITTFTPEAQIEMASPTTVKAHWQLQCSLTVKSEYGNPVYQRWHDANAEAAFSVDPIADHQDGSRHRFVGWSLPSSPITADTPEATINMDLPVTVVAHWQLQYHLALKVNPSGTAEISGEGWYDAGISVSTGAAPSIVEGDAGTRYVFLSWKVDDIQEEGNPISISMDAPRSAIVDYETQYYLTVESEYGEPQGSGWYAAGSQAPISVESSAGSIIKDVFAEWSQGADADEPSTTVLMDEPKTVMATWRKDYIQLYTLAGVILAVVAVASALAFRRLRGRRAGRISS